MGHDLIHGRCYASVRYGAGKEKPICRGVFSLAHNAADAAFNECIGSNAELGHTNEAAMPAYGMCLEME